MKYLILSLISVFFGILIVLAWSWWSLQPVNSSVVKVSFVVAKNETGDLIVNRLYTSGLIKSTIVSKIYLRLTGTAGRLKPGGYVLTPNLTTPQIFSVLSSGPKDIWITFPEGWRREQIAQRLQENISDFDTSDFLRLTQNLEGQLFPDTYLIPATAAPADVVRIMTQNLAKKTDLDLALSADREVLILASLVEREAKTDSDRKLIAGIFQKRLAAGWPLQVDASVQYAVNHTDPWWQPITDTKYPSLYNTYLYPGLPPGPICNPGLAAITAVRSPQTSPYWYYLTGVDGVTYYARNLDEHNLNIDKHL